MDSDLLKYLDKHEIKYKIHLHPAIFTVAQSKELNLDLPGVFHTKNLFLKDEADNFFLVCMSAYSRANLKELKNSLNAKKKLYFASESELKEHLNVTPGSVSIFAMMHSKGNVILVLDKKIVQAEKSGFHPNINTATLEISSADLKKFLATLKSQVVVLEI